MFYCKKICEGFTYACLERGLCLSGNGVVNFLEAWNGDIINGFFNDMKLQR